MKKGRREQIVRGMEYCLVPLTVCLILLHFYLTFLNFFHGIDKGYGHSFPPRCYVLIGIYLCLVPLANAILIWRRYDELRKVFCRYWGSAFLIVAANFLWYMRFSELTTVLALGLLYAPALVLHPLLELLGSSRTELLAAGGFCLLNLVLTGLGRRRRGLV